jgi:hypothetical protein
MMMKSCQILVACLLIATSALALEPITPESRGLGGSVVLSEPSASTLAFVPGGSMPFNQWTFDASFDRRYELNDLDQLAISGAYQFTPVILSLAFSQFGETDLYTEWSTRLGASVRIDSLSVGLYMTNMIIGAGGYYNKLRYTTLGAGASFRTTYVLAAITADNLTSPKPIESAAPIEPDYTVYIEARRGPASTYSLTGHVTMEDGQKPQYGVGQKVAVSKLGSLMMGVSTAPFEFGGGVVVNFSGFSLTWTVNNHPDLGLSYTVGLGYGR